MSKLAQALRIAEARRNRTKKQLLLFGLVALLVLAALLLAYQWANRSLDLASVVAPKASLVPALSNSAPASEPALPSANETAPPAFLQVIAEYQDALSGLEEHARFGEDVRQVLGDLRQLQEQLSSHDFTTLKPYYDDTLATAKGLVDEVERFKLQLLDDIERAYIQRNAKAFQAAMQAYESLGRDLDRIVQWRDIGEQPERIFQLLKEAKSHQVQNNPSKELSVLQQLEKLGFTRENIPERIAELKQTLHTTTINQWLQAAHDFYSNGRFVEAKSVLDKVLKADPSNGSAQQLLSVVEGRLNQQKFDALYAHAQASSSADRWSDAKQAYQQALSLQPNHKLAMEGLQLASDISGLEIDMQGLLATSLRLGDKQVSRYALDLLEKAEAYTSYSLRLTDVSKQLRLSLTQMSTPAQIAIKSDGKARIEVRGVGYIEPTKYKVISLTPGMYELYTHCKGHVVGMSRLEIPVNQPSLEISVGCGRKL
jgi:tetratricopeptide (TPR) repeat protein